MSKSKSRWKSEQSALRNTLQFQHNFQWLTEMAVGRFIWKNMPPTVDTRFLELELCRSGLVLFMDNPDYGVPIVCKGSLYGPPNFNDNYSHYRIVAYPGLKSRVVSAKECVPIYGTLFRDSIFDSLYYYAEKLTEIDITQRVNMMQVRFPKFVKCNQDNLLTFTNIQNRVQQGDPIVYVSDGLAIDDVNVFDVSVPHEYIETVRNERNQVVGEALTFLGIVNSSGDKRERLVSAEARGDYGAVVSRRSIGMTPRLQAAEIINKRYGLNIEVEWGYRTVDTIDLEGGRGEPLHDDPEKGD